MNNKGTAYQNLSDVPEAVWQELTLKKIYFGHQSVGYNIIEGINAIIKSNDKIKLNISELDKATQFEGGIFAHSEIGENTKPISKINEFSDLISTTLKDKVDIAFFKLCFEDIKANTDINTLFSSYKNAMTKLRKENPNVIFLQTTVPLLRRQQGGMVSWLKKMIGKDDGYFSNKHNMARNEFNQMARKEYAGNGTLFDVAEIESTNIDGTMSTFNEGGNTYFSLAGDYTDDGGHLNKLGQKIVAEKLLLMLANLVK